jgi:hypothetical protein
VGGVYQEFAASGDMDGSDAGDANEELYDITFVAFVGG